MTEDYKKTLLDYITTLTPGTPTNDEIFESTQEILRSAWEDYIPASWQNFKFSGVLRSKTSDKVVFYGGYIP